MESNEIILDNIKNTYIPFLKKLIGHLEKTKDNHPKTEKLKYVYNTFLDADSKEKVNVYVACKDMLDKWYMRYKKRKGHGDEKKSTVNDPQSEDSQSEVLPAAKNAKEKSSAAPSAVKSSIEQRGGICFQDEIEIESSDSSTSLPMTSGTTDTSANNFPIIKIKQEKEDTSAKKIIPTPKIVPMTKPVPATPPRIAPALSKPTVAVIPQAQSVSNPGKEVVFVCASCQFRTTVEADFMKHARTDHRTDLSLWCKKCGRCFSNAGVLVSHIKEDSCEKEEMIYRCGVKDCTFETASGQTFVHHLRHCHKGSPFIFCIHCQKIFTLPHCLILHMQNECPFKEKNRRDPSSVLPTPPAPSEPAASPVVQPAIKATTVSQTPNQPAKIAPKPGALQPTSRMTTPSGQLSGRGGGSLRTRARTRGRPSRTRFSDSSDSEDADDPSWKPEESTNNQPLRRSARWAKKVSDAKDPELYETEPVSSKAKSSSELPGKTFFHCPCCDFSALFKSLLLDHYVTDHKHQKRMSCLVCSVKFENKQGFLDHFTIHENEKDNNKSSNEFISETADVSSKVQVPIPIEVVPANNVIEKKTEDMKIPYQTSIQEKLQNETKLKSFEDLKSADDVIKMKTDTKLQHFYKCVVHGCTFTTDDNVFYVKHLTEHHSGKKLHCGYCFTEFKDAKSVADHMLKDHGKRFYQCSICFYRASSKAHVQIHMKNSHPTEKIQYFKCSQHLPLNYSFDKDVEEPDLTTTYPYACAIGDCTYKTHEPKEFKKHNDITHRSVTVFFCHYCKVDFISFKRLMSHYHLHGINNYQCTYCIHGSETKEEILLHLCSCHADKSLKVHVRAADNQAAKKVSDDKVSDVTNTVKKTAEKAPTVSFENLPEDCSDKKFMYPVEVKALDKEIFCRLGFCSKLFDNLHCYLKHLINDHSASNFLCPYCSTISDSLIDFENHMHCHGPNLFACAKEKCYWFSPHEKEVKEHMVNKHKMGDAQAEAVRQTPGLVIPVLKILPESLPKLNKADAAFVCPLCGYKCSSRGCMKNHLYQEMVYKRFQCNICKAKLCSRSETKLHFKSLHSHHNIKCSIDANAEIETIVAFILSDKLQKFIHECVQKENFSWKILSGMPVSRCKNCQTHLPTVKELHYHQLSCLSHGYEPYICNHCGSKAVDLMHMKKHTAEHHPGSAVQYSTFPNKLLEEQQGRKLQEVRLVFLKETALCILNKTLLDDPKSVAKHYKCAYCKFVDNFRSNISKHCLGCHKDKDLSVEKIKQSGPDVSALEEEKDTLPSTTEPEPMDTSINEGYVCVYCMQKTPTLTQLENHVESNHQPSITDNVYPYFYCPDPNAEYASNDAQLYECAYCSVSQENLYHLKRHCNNLHAAAIFQVRGHKSKDGSMLTCKYCECKVVSRELLSKHCRFTHPGKPIKTANDIPTKQAPPPPLKRKKADDKDSSTSKRPKVTIQMYQCSYCSFETDTVVKIVSHQEINHPEEELSYKEICKDLKDVSTDEVKMYYCDICSFVSDKELLQKHMGRKHAGCVCCGHCDRYLESVEALLSHTADEHKGLPAKEIDPPGCDSSDLNNTTVNTVGDSNKSSTKLNKFAKIYPMFPKIILKDFKK